MKVDDMKNVLACEKRGIVCGWLSQFICMPLVAYAFAQIFEYNAALAFGCILCGCAPGDFCGISIPPLVAQMKRRR